MGKGPEWSEVDTVQLCRSWLVTSEDPVVGTGQKKTSFLSRLYEHWLENKTGESGQDRLGNCSRRSLKKIQPELTKFCGVYAKVKSRECSGWNDEMYLDAALKIYAERHKQPFDFHAAWNELKDKLKWTTKITSDSGARAKRKASRTGDVARPGGRKAAKAVQQEICGTNKGTGAEAQLRLAAAAKKNGRDRTPTASGNFHAGSESDKSKEFFAMQRKAIIKRMKQVSVAATHELPSLIYERLTSPEATGLLDTAAANTDKENDSNT